MSQAIRAVVVSGKQIAERIVALKAVGVDLILSGFLHFREEVEYFGKHVLPLVRELEEENAPRRRWSEEPPPCSPTGA